MPTIGRLSDPVILQTPTTTDDGQGGQTVTWANTRTVWAQIEHVGASEARAAGTIQRNHVYRLTVRADSAWVPTTRAYLSAKAVTTEIVGVRDPDGRGRWLELDAVEIDA